MTVPARPNNPSNRRRVPAQRQPNTTIDDVGGLPLITARLDSHGALEPGAEATLLDALDATAATDLLVFSHGWNTDNWTADGRASDGLASDGRASDRRAPAGGPGSAPARAFFQAVPALLQRFGQPGRRVALLDLQWPGRRWSDEPLPGPAVTDGHEQASASVFAFASVSAPPPPDETSRRVTRAAFGPEHRERVDELLGLLATRPDDSTALKRARVLIRILAESAPDAGDGERREVTSMLEIDDPYPDQLFADFALRLSELGVITDPDGGRAGFGDSVSRLWHGAQEAVRQLTYWQLKGAAVAAGEQGLGPLIGRLHARRPELGITLIGHGLGARAVGHGLRSLPPGAVRSVILMQAVLSHFAFADKLPFEPSRSGVLAGLQDRVTGPVVACYSRHDTAIGVFYQLAARAAGPDTAGFETAGHRWAGLGQDGHQPAAREFALNPPGVSYDFARSGLVNIDASWVVGHGPPPSGAHADICHPELAWIALNAADLC